MKKLLLLSILLTSTMIAFSQGAPFPNYQPQGNSVTRWSQQGAVQGIKGIINGIYPDTATANIGYIDYYPGAQIFTTNDKFIWVRDFPAVRWIRQSPTITSFTFNTDSSIVVCYGNGVCDTLSMFNFTTVVNNIVQNFNDSTIYQINDSTLIICNLAGSCDTIDLGTTNIFNIYTDTLGNQFVVTCDTIQVICVTGTSVGDSCYQQQLCDTIPIQHLSTPFYQNLLRIVPTTTIREHGSAQGDIRGQMVHDTWAYLGYNKLTFEGYALERPMVTFAQQQWNQFSSSIISLNHYGTYPPDGRIDSANKVNLYFNYFNKFVFDTTGFMHDRVGYPIITNARGSRYSLGIDNANSKQTGIMLHTLDTAYTDAVTIFGNQTPNQYAFSVSPFPTSTLLDSRIAIFKTDKTVQIPGYPNTRDDGVTSKALFTDADGNMKLGTITGAGDIITIINDTTINICSFGTNLCDTITINNIGVIQTVFVLNDSTLVVCDSVGVCDTLIISSTEFSQPITARNGLIMATPTEVQFGQGIGAPGNPAILLSHREIPLANFTINFNAAAAQTNNMMVWKNPASAVRARITSAASFSNTGGQTGSEVFGDGSTVTGINSIVFGSASTASTAGIAIGPNVNSGSNILITSSSGVNVSAFIAGVAVGGLLTANGATSVGGSSSAGNQAVAIGVNSLASATGSTALGGNTTATAGNAVAINGTAGFASSISIQGNTTATNQLVIGRDVVPIIDGYFGDGVTSATPNSFVLNGTGGSGTNIAGASFTLAGGKGSGAATPGVVNIATSVIGASGTTLQTLANRAIISDKSFNINATRFEEYKGANVAAANDLTLGIDGNLFTITGATQINAITTANWQAGSTIGFIFTGAPLVKHNTAGGAGTATMLLAGSADFQAAAGDNIEFRYDGTNWHEIGRTLAASGSVTANSGLRMSTPTNVQLGATASGSANSPLLQNSYINTNTLRLYVYGESATLPPLTANNFSGGPAFHAVSTTGPAVYAQTNSGTPINSTLTASSQNSSLEILRLNRETTGGGGVGQVGIGAYIDMLLHTSTTAGQLATRFNTEYTVVTHGSQTSKLTISGVNGGSTVEALVLGGEGYVKLRPITATAASAITPAEGMLVFVSNTDATFVSIGIWCYQNGAWKAL